MSAQILDELTIQAHVYVNLLIDWANECRLLFNQSARGLEAWQVAAYTFAATCAFVWVKTLWGRIKHAFFKHIRRIPWVENQIKKEMAKLHSDIDEQIHKCDPKREFVKFLPEIGIQAEDLISEVEKYDALSPYEITDGSLSGAVYSDMPPKLMNVLQRVFELYSYSNPLHPDIFPGCRKMEAEVVRMVCNMYNGGPESCGTVTCGGTESILCAMLCYRNRAYDRGIEHPEMVIPITAHAAFDKAADYFRIRVKHIACDPDTMQVNINAMRRAITSNTCVLVGSAPNFPHGTIDPIGQISELGVKYQIPVHVDACLGGFLLPFMEQVGYTMAPFDFRLAGVTSVSCDTHKYGYSPKGTSLVIYKNDTFLHYQYFAQVDWPGGLYATPTLAGSRSGCNIALTWATMMFYGKDGYRQACESIIETTQFIRNQLDDIDELVIYGTSEVSVISIGSDVVNPYGILDQLQHKGWILNSLQHPPAFHICVTLNHTKPGVAQKFVDDVKDCTARVVANPEASKSKTAALYGSSTTVPDRSLVAECTHAFLDSCYSTWSPHRDLSRKVSRSSSAMDGMLYGRAHSMADDSEAMKNVMMKLQRMSEEATHDEQ